MMLTRVRKGKVEGWAVWQLNPLGEFIPKNQSAIRNDEIGTILTSSCSDVDHTVIG